MSCKLFKDGVDEEGNCCRLDCDCYGSKFKTWWRRINQEIDVEELDSEELARLAWEASK